MTESSLRPSNFNSTWDIATSDVFDVSKGTYVRGHEENEQLFKAHFSDNLTCLLNNAGFFAGQVAVPVGTIFGVYFGAGFLGLLH